MKSYGISLGTLNVKLLILCVAPLYLPGFTFFYIPVFSESFFHKCNIVTSWCNFSSFFVNGTIFFFTKLITFRAFSLKEVQNFFIYSSPRYKVWLFSILSKAHKVGIEHPQGICSPIFVVEEFSGLFAHPSVFLVKIQYQRK